jgi:hypothetical protein
LELVGKLHESLMTGEAIIIPLGDFCMNLQIGTQKDESYSHMGKEYVAKASAPKTVVISTREDFFKQMDRRSTAFAVAGNESAAALAASLGMPFDPATMALPQSTVSYLEPGSGTVLQKDCWCTKAGEEMQKQRMEVFAERYPHVTGASMKAVDEEIQKEI